MILGIYGLTWPLLCACVWEAEMEYRGVTTELIKYTSRHTFTEGIVVDFLTHLRRARYHLYNSMVIQTRIMGLKHRDMTQFKVKSFAIRSASIKEKSNAGRSTAGLYAVTIGVG